MNFTILNTFFQNLQELIKYEFFTATLQSGIHYEMHARNYIQNFLSSLRLITKRDQPMELGLCTFADLSLVYSSGISLSTHQRIANLMEEIKLADELGLDVFGIGEHHRPDYTISSPATILAAAAAITKKIKLTSAVTVLSSEDPVRAFQ